MITHNHRQLNLQQTRSSHKRPSTLARDRGVLKRHVYPVIGAVPMASVTPLDIRKVVEPMLGRLAPSTIRGNVGVVKAMFRAAVDADVIPMSPCRGIKRPTERPTEKHFLDASQLDLLAESIDPQYRSFIYVAGVIGLRWSELAGLRVRSVDFLKRTLTVSETVAEVEGRLMEADTKSPASRRTLSVPPFLIDMLAADLAARSEVDPDAYLFRSPRGGPLRYSNFHRTVWKPAVEKSGLSGVTIHALRHTAAGLMIEVGAHPRVIQQRLGHSSITTTMNVYGSVLPGVEDGVTRGLDDLFRGGSGADVVQRGAGDPR